MLKKLLICCVPLALLAMIATTPFVPAQSIQPIQYTDQDVTLNICTTFSINESRQLWVSALHCMMSDVTIAGQEPVVVFADWRNDIVVLVANKRPAMKLAKHMPAVGDAVTIIGYADGSHALLPFFGRVSAPAAEIQAGSRLAVYNLLGRKGDSGAPIVDRTGHVVGIGQTSSLGGIVASVPLDTLTDSLRAFID